MRFSLSDKIARALKSWPERLPTPLGIAFDLVPAPPELAGSIRGAQIRAIVRFTPVAVIASCLNAMILLVTWSSVARASIALWVWASLIFLLSANYVRNWLGRRALAPDRPASRRALRRMLMHATVLGSLWGAVPVITFPKAPLDLQLLIGCLTAGMMCAGGFVMATAPLAGTVYVLLVAGGALIALLQMSGAVYLGLMALLVVYAAFTVGNINWSGALFVSSRLAEAQVRTEVAARELAQEKAAHAERLAALGQLAGGVAHDFNNVLQAVGGSAALIERHPADADQVRDLAHRVADAVERGGAISRRLLAFARRDVLSAETVDVADMFRELAELLAPTIGRSIDLRIELAEPALAVLADHRQLETVLVNLAANARDAIKGAGGLTFAAAGEVVADGAGPPGLAPGRYVRISLTDTGAGMDEATLSRAVEPFFTTKPRGKGTGLGLSMAKGFAEQSEGAFSIVSAPGRGSTATLWLPQAERPGRIAENGHPHAAAGEQRSGGKILVVDDDDLVRAMLVTTLQDAGFHAAGADSGADALMQFDSDTDIDAVVTDLAMPGLSGWDLIRELRSREPDLPILMLTGHAEDDRTAPQGQPPPDRFLLMEKPVTPDQLAERLGMLMDECGRPRAAVSDMDAR
jgi:signal transduction histidine kinase/CheY-like chemotaxis protein